MNDFFSSTFDNKLQEVEFGQEVSNGVVSDIAWAPVMGRSYHLIAVATRQPSCKVSLIEIVYLFIALFHHFFIL